MNASGKEKADVLLQIIGVGPQLIELDQKEKELYQERLYVGRTADQKAKFAKEMTYYDDVPKELISPSELIKQQQEILARNGENERKRSAAVALNAERNRLAEKVNALKEELERYQAQLIRVDHDMNIAYKTAEELHDESTAELEASIANIDEINRKIRANLDKEKAEDDAREYLTNYEKLTGQIENIRQKRTALLDAAELPLAGLSVKDGELIYNGQKWDNMSGSDQLKVSTAIVRKLNPNCGFVLLDKLEQMDMQTLEAFGQWLEGEGLQAIATRVSTGDECSIIIEDGYIKNETVHETEAPKWRSGF